MQPYLLDSGLQKGAAQRAHRLQRNSGNPGLEDLCTIAGIYCLSDDCAIVSLTFTSGEISGIMTFTLLPLPVGGGVFSILGSICLIAALINR